MTEPVVYLNGRVLPASQAHIAIYDAGIVLGATITEMTRTFRHRPWRLDHHLDRLYRSIKYTRFEVRETKAELHAATLEVAQHNAQLLEEGGELGIVHFITAGEYPTYAGSAGKAARTSPTVCCHTFPMPWELWAAKMVAGAHVVTPSIRHVPPQCYDPKMKYRSRMHYYLADHEARLVDPNAMALLLDLDGNITETSGANFLIVDRGTIVSPTTRNTLPGISRAMVMELAAKMAIPFVEKDIQVHDVMNAGEAFLTTTPYCIMPVTKINGTVIADGKPGPLFRQLLDLWSQEVGLDIDKQIQDGARRRQATG